MPAPSDMDPEERTASGSSLVDLYCTGCDAYSGGGLCRQCQREADIGIPISTEPVGQLQDPEPAPSVESDVANDGAAAPMLL